ncbi:hypothetical protein [Promicromonospora soli]|uniref:Uncharacterized protein n=1 Tax=Promicromonospora soli TaxID=2035533 RepID=A0A919KNW5_9MICO|nr:hypothetical protein [Promicromonospora soli]GHH67589.1 hypothetical protein GCM10017772_09580 [Promicromonospora soli]
MRGWVVALVALVGGCAQTGAAGSASGDAGEYLCQGTRVPAAVLTDGATTADQLGDEAAAALDGASVPGIEPERWRVLTEISTQVYLIRELPEPRDADDGERRTHELLGIEWTDQTEEGGEGWQLWRHGDCALRYDLGGLGDAIVALDPDNPPDPVSSEVHLLVTEIACAGGEPADGRLTLERLVELEDRVELVIGVEAPPGDAQTCQSNPPTPFTIELDEPLGDRTLMDGAVYPERELAAVAKV